MRHGLPVLAYSLPAVAETLGNAGLRFSTKDFAHLARYLADVLNDEDRRSAVVEAQIRRADELMPLMSGAGFFELMAS
jgi:glycosyltransferase involved in cell wall biosynthesis